MTSPPQSLGRGATEASGSGSGDERGVCVRAYVRVLLSVFTGRVGQGG